MVVMTVRLLLERFDTKADDDANDNGCSDNGNGSHKPTGTAGTVVVVTTPGAAPGSVITSTKISGVFTVVTPTSARSTSTGIVVTNNAKVSYKDLSCLALPY
jgi:hypothetical protein